MDESPASPIIFDGMVARLIGDRSIVVEETAPGPPERIDGYSLGVAEVTEGPGPHNGEMHPDGDELLLVVAGTMELILDDGDRDVAGTETCIRLDTGDAFVVPRGTWHKVLAREPSRLLYLTPGPGGDYRPQPG